MAPASIGGPLPAGCGFTVAVVPSPATGPAPLLVHFNATVSSGSPSEYDWNFGDGSYWNSSVAGASSPLHRYANPGEYSATVAATEAGCSMDGAATVAASPGTLSVTLTATPTSGAAPLTVEFAANVTGGSGTYVSALWSFGDGSAGSGIPIAYTYQRPGTFSYRVNVTDSNGHWAVASGTEVVQSTAGGGSGDLLGVPPGTVLLAVVLALATVLAGAALFFVGRRFSVGSRIRAPPSDGDSRGREHPTAATRVSESAVGADGGGDAGGVPAESVGVARPPSRFAAALPPEVARPHTRARVQLTQRVVLHIGAQGRVGPDEVGRYALTQAGMASALGVGQNTITNVLRRLVAAGVLTQEVRHVSGQARRLRVYRFTSRGESVYQDVRRRRDPRDSPVEFSDPERTGDHGSD